MLSGAKRPVGARRARYTRVGGVGLFRNGGGDYRALGSPGLAHALAGIVISPRRGRIKEHPIPSRYRTQ